MPGYKGGYTCTRTHAPAATRTARRSSQGICHTQTSPGCLHARADGASGEARHEYGVQERQPPPKRACAEGCSSQSVGSSTCQCLRIATNEQDLRASTTSEQ